MSDSVIDAMATEPKVQPSLHLPVQSGSDRILTAMERGYTVGEYLELVERVRAAIPAIALSTDIIVGFHGEEETDFRATLELMARSATTRPSPSNIRCARTRAHSGSATRSAKQEKGRRLAAVIALQERVSAERNRALVGERFAVLVEGPARRGGGMLAGQDAAVQDRGIPGRRFDKPGRYGDGARRVGDRAYAALRAGVIFLKSAISLGAVHRQTGAGNPARPR